jgi:spore coat protein H
LPSFSEPSEQLFDQAVLHEIDIEISDENLALLDPPTDDRVPVRLTVDGTTADDVGLRLKQGWGQFQPFDKKPGFSIETDEFVDDVTLFDVDRFTLGNATWDHSFVNEPLIYAVYEAAGIPAPRTALARVTVNGETFGIYVLRETYKERMLAQHFADPTGNLYELAGVPDEPDMGLQLRTNKDEDDTSDLAAVIEVVETASDEEYRAAIEELVDVDELMTYWAIEALVGHHDGYAYDLGVPGLFPGRHPPTQHSALDPEQLLHVPRPHERPVRVLAARSRHRARDGGVEHVRGRAVGAGPPPTQGGRHRRLEALGRPVVPR